MCFPERRTSTQVAIDIHSVVDQKEIIINNTLSLKNPGVRSYTPEKKTNQMKHR